MRAPCEFLLGLRLGLRATVALAIAAALALLALSAPAEAKPAQPRITLKPGGFTSGKQVRVVVRGAGPRFRAVVGSRVISSRFRRAGNRRRVAVLRRGRELRAGTNRIVVSAGRGKDRRYVAATVVLGRRAGGHLQVRRLNSPRSALLLQIRGPRGKKRFQHLRILVNGRRVRGRSWVVGARTRAADWPLGRRSFRAILGASEGVRFGRNRIAITAWRDDGTFDRVRRTVRISRRAPVPDAGHGARVRVRRGVRLDARRTRAGGGRRVSYRWQIVRAPKGSKAKLREARSARPRLVPDRPGTYRIRLLASRSGRHKTGKRHAAGKRGGRHKTGKRGAGASAAAPLPSTVAVDETTVQATPADGPIGVPIQALTASGGVQVGSQSIPPEGPWAQLVVLDRFTLEVKESKGFGSSSTVTAQDVEELEEAVRGLEPDVLVVITGGDRQVKPNFEEFAVFQNFAGVIDQVGGYGNAIFEWENNWKREFSGGNWSIVGVPGLEGSAYQNLFGGIFGKAAGEGSASGAITGYLQATPSRLYAFQSANVTTFDTNVPGSPPGVNQIRIGDQVYSSDPIGEAQSGFQVLVANSLLEVTYNHTFVVSEGFHFTKQSEVVAMQEKLSDLSSPNLGAPGYLFIIQSVGHPFGAIDQWVDDEKILNNVWGEQVNATIPRNNSTWYAPANVGESLAGALGELGGPLAHDQIAQMSIAGSQPGEPKPAGTPGGFTLVASSGSVSNEGQVVDATSAPVSLLQATARTPTARVTGSLGRDHQSYWAVDTGSSIPGFEEPSLQELLYQAPQPWPLSQTPEQKAALAYISEMVDSGKSANLRTLYWEDFKGGFSGVKTEVGKVRYRKGKGFSENTFEAVQGQLELELAKVEEVKDLISDWEEVFAANNETGRVDIQDVSSAIISSLKSFNSGASTTARVAGITDEALWFASSLLELAGQEEYAAPLGAAAGGLGFIDAVFESGGEQHAETGPVETEASQLGAALAVRLGNIRKAMRLIGEILVSDWGKLQAASAYSKNKNQWEYTSQAESALIESVKRGTERELTTALLASTYDVYVVNPGYISSEFRTPSDIKCIEHENFLATIHPFDDYDENPSSWIVRTIAYEPGGTTSINRFVGMTLPVSVSEFHIKNHAHSAPNTVTSRLFGPVKAVVKKNEQQNLNQDPLAVFADPRFKQLWFSCRPPG